MMTKKYEAPQIEVIEIEIEGAVLSTSGIETTTTGYSLGTRASSSRTSTIESYGR